MTYKYNPGSKEIEGVPEHPKPKRQSLVYMDEWGDFDNNLYQDHLATYHNYLQSLPKYKVLNPPDTWIGREDLKEGVDFELFDAAKFFWCECACGWEGSSEHAAGGGQIADTGDYGDAECPKCFSTDIESDKMDNVQGIVAVPIEPKPQEAMEENKVKARKSDESFLGEFKTGGYCPACLHGIEDCICKIYLPSTHPKEPSVSGEAEAIDAVEFADWVYTNGLNRSEYELQIGMWFYGNGEFAAMNTQELYKIYKEEKINRMAEFHSNKNPF